MTISDIINQRNITLDETNKEMSYRANGTGEHNKKFNGLSVNDLSSIFCILLLSKRYKEKNTCEYCKDLNQEKEKITISTIEISSAGFYNYGMPMYYCPVCGTKLNKYN